MNVLHFGMPKAGSTYLQSVIFPHILSSPRNAHSTEESVYTWLQTVRDQPDSLDLPKICSSERLFGIPGFSNRAGSFFRRDGFNRFLDHVEAFAMVASKVIPLIVIRDTASYAKALYLQARKTRRAPSTLDEYLAKQKMQDFSIYDRLSILRQYNAVAIFQDDLRMHAQLVSDYLCDTINRPRVSLPKMVRSVNVNPRTELGMFLCMNAGSLIRRLKMGEKVINRFTRTAFGYDLFDAAMRDNVDAALKDKIVRFGDGISLLNRELLTECTSHDWLAFFKEDWHRTRLIMNEMRLSLLPEIKAPL